MGLEKYWKKRHFERTPEPQGRVQPRPGGAPLFVVQKHAASHLHYDFRLEIDGTLKSWAIPKGPSLDPGEKRLAVEVEDHPLAYAGFEGRIPAGEYGGGTVLLWDRGTWTPEGDAAAALARGRLHFRLDGEKLHGAWTLIRLGGTGAKGRHDWLLIKHRDEFARPDAEVEITEERTESVLSGRELDEIAARPPGRRPARRAGGHRAPPPAVPGATPASAGVHGVKTAGAAAPGPGAERPDTAGVTPVPAEAAVTVAGVRLTHAGRVLYPESGLRKQDVAEYYARIAPWLLPQLRERPLTLLRCPQGLGSCFVQRHLEPRPPALLAVQAPAAGEAPHVAANSVEAVLALVQLGVLELHTWGARRDRLDRPDRLVFDLDPAPEVGWPDFVAHTRLLRELLQELALPAFLKTTGGKGVHVEVPLRREHGWEEVHAFAQAVAQLLAQQLPRHFVAQAGRAERHGRIYIDYQRNVCGASAVAAYSLRARPGAPVALPLHWEELPGWRPGQCTLRNVFARLAALTQDPWQDYEAARARLSRARLARLGGGE